MSVNTSRFIFWEEILNLGRYEEIIPSRELGLLILRLYDLTEKKKTLSEYFKHSDIEDIYWEVNNTPERRQKEDARNDIEKLKKYFLTYSVLQNEYHLRDHAIVFGKMVYDLLEARFNPTLVEQICRTLRHDLQIKIKDNSFKEWYNVVFNPNRSALQQQLDLLDNKIDKLISDLQNKKLEDTEVLTMLESVSEHLKRILEEYEQLRSAYSETKVIRSELLDFQKGVGDDDREILEEALTYFDLLRKQLNAISERLGRIQPKIQQLFGVFNQGNFGAKIDRFTNYLLSESSLVKNRLVLPPNIPSFNLQIKTSHLKYFDTSRSPFPRPIQPRTTQVYNTEDRDTAFLEATENVRRQNEALEWLDILDQDLEEKEEIILLDYFTKVFQNDWSRLEIALRFVYLVLQKYTNHSDWNITFHTPLKPSPHKHIQLWNVIISR